MADDPNARLCPTHLGACGELIAAAWLLSLGYEVFRNVSGVGPADLSIWHPTLGDFALVDVKTQPNTRVGANGLISVTSTRARHADVHILIVSGGEVAGFFRKKEDTIPARYWPLAVKAPTNLPDGYNEDDDAPQAHVAHLIEWDGRLASLPELAREAGISVHSLRTRLRRNMPLAAALATPIANRGQRR